MDKLLAKEKFPRPTHIVPSEYRYVYDEYFTELHERRTYAPDGSRAHLSFQDILTWTTLANKKLDAWELKTILALDKAWFAQLAEERDKKTE